MKEVQDALKGSENAAAAFTQLNELGFEFTGGDGDKSFLLDVLIEDTQKGKSALNWPELIKHIEWAFNQELELHPPAHKPPTETSAELKARKEKRASQKAAAAAPVVAKAPRSSYTAKPEAGEKSACCVVS